MADGARDLVDIGRRLFTATSDRDWADLVALVHPDAVLELRSQPGRIIHGRQEVEAFARDVIARRQAHEITLDHVEQLDDSAVVALGRLFVSDVRGIRDGPVGWLMLFEDRMLRRSLGVRSVAEARQLLAQVRAEEGHEGEELETVA